MVGGQADVEEIMIFEDLLRELYRKFGFEIKNGRMTEQIVGLPPNRYQYLKICWSLLMRK